MEHVDGVERPERGSVLPMLALALAGLLVAVMVLAAVAQRARDRARAQAAADAAALAGAAAGERAATELANANGGDLTAFVSDGGRVRAVVVVSGVPATAVAEIQLVNPPDQ